MEKLEILVNIANSGNYGQLLSELHEYSMEVDMDFVRRSIKAIGQVAIKIDAAAPSVWKFLRIYCATRLVMLFRRLSL